MLQYIWYEITIDLYEEEESITQNKDNHTLPIAYTSCVCLNQQMVQTIINIGPYNLKIK